MNAEKIKNITLSQGFTLVVIRQRSLTLPSFKERMVQ